MARGTSSLAHNVGLLFIRLGLGFFFFYFHGWSKLAGGPDLWISLGHNMGLFGIHFFPAFWGFASACIEFLAGILIFLGLFFRPATFFLTLNMIVASASMIHNGATLFTYPIEIGIVIFSLLIAGPGKFSIDHWRSLRRQRQPVEEEEVPT